MNVQGSEPSTRDWTSVWSTLERVLRPRFRFSSSAAAEARDESDYKEAVAEAFALVKCRLDNPDAEPVDDIDGFAARVAQNVFKGLLKKKYPVRHKLALEIRSTLEFDPRLGYWLVSRTGVGGKVAWEGMPPRHDGNGKLVLEDPSRATTKCFAVVQPNQLLTPDLLLTFYAWVNGPFGYDATVGFCFQSLGLSEITYHDSGADTQEPVDERERPEEMANARALAALVWNEVKALESRRRGVFLLFEPPGTDQEPICDRLLCHGVCTLHEIAEMSGISFEALCELRQLERVTYDDVGNLLGMSPKEAENIRRGVTDLLWRRLIASGYRKG